MARDERGLANIRTHDKQYISLYREVARMVLIYKGDLAKTRAKNVAVGSMITMPPYFGHVETLWLLTKVLKLLDKHSILGLLQQYWLEAGSRLLEQWVSLFFLTILVWKLSLACKEFAEPAHIPAIIFKTV